MKVFFLFVSCFIVNCCIAQKDTANARDLAEVVVTGQYKPQSVKNSVYQVRTITKKRILEQGAVNLQTVLSNELNIRFSQDMATGGSNITMMGLSGQNVKVLIDGLPMTGRQGTSNEVDINQVDINSIERIEIVEGPMSVVFGADALAGVINIITKKSSPQKFTVSVRLHEEGVGNEYSFFNQGIHNQSLSAGWKNKGWEIGGGISHNYFGGWKDTAIDRELVWHKKDQVVGNVYAGYSKNNFSIRYRMDGLDEIIANPGNYQPFPDPVSGQNYAYDQEYLSSRVMHQLQSGYTFSNKANVQLQTAYSDYSRQVYSTVISKQTGKVNVDPGAGKQSIIDFTSFTFRTLVNYKLSKLVTFQPGIDINLESGKGERLQSGRNNVNDYAFFLTAEFTPNEKINIRPGVRVIKNSVYDAPPAVPSINAKLALSKNVDLRVAYANGFRSPSIRELYFNFFDANHQIIGNANLKAETSNSFTASLNWQKVTAKQVAYSTIISGFYNNVKNLIDYAISANDPNVFQLTNVSNSKTSGVSITSVAKYKHWSITVGGSYTGFYNDYSESDKSLPQLQWSAEINSIVNYTIPKTGINVNLFYKHTGKRPFYTIDTNQQVVQAEQKGFHMADVTLSKKAFGHFTFNAGVRNLLNVTRINSSVISGGVHAGGSERNIATGRTFFAGITYQLEKN